MGFMNFEFPNSDYYKHDLRELIALVKELSERVENIGEGILEQAEAYTDEQLAGYQAQVDELREELAQTVQDLQTQYVGFTEIVNARIVFISSRVDRLEESLVASIEAVNARTDLAIEQNNEYLLEHMSEELANIKVLNYFTGTLYTVQDMFDYLCMLHVENGITYTELANRQKTYNELIAYNMTYTQLAQNGGAIIQ